MSSIAANEGICDGDSAMRSKELETLARQVALRFRPIGIHDREDLLSEALVAGLQADRNGMVRAQVKTIMLNRVIDVWRKETRHLKHQPTGILEEATCEFEEGLAVGSIIDDPSKPLTSRQREITRLLGEGLNQSDVARKLSITRQAVSKSLQAVKKRCRSNARADGWPPREVKEQSCATDRFASSCR